MFKDELYKAYEKGIKSHGVRGNNPTTKSEFIKRMEQWYDLVDKNTYKECVKRNLI